MKNQAWLVGIGLLLSAVHALALFWYPSAGVIGLSAVVFLGRTIFFCVLLRGTDVLQTIMWVYCDLSLICWPIVFPLRTRLPPTVGVKYAVVVGVVVLIVLLVCSLVGNKLWKKSDRPRENVVMWSRIPSRYAAAATIGMMLLAFGATLLSIRLGIAQLGMERPELPFQFAGVLHWFRLYGVPIAVIVALDFYYKRGSLKNIDWLLVVYVVWLVVEGVARISKGQVIYGLLPVGIWLLYTRTLIKRYVKVGVGLIVVQLSLFPLIGALRALLKQGIGEYHWSVLVEMVQAKYGGVGTSVAAIYERVFATGPQIAEFAVALEGRISTGLGITEVARAGGPSAYHTHVIENVPVDVPYSAGSTAISGAVLTGGLLAVVLMAGVLSIFSVIIDRGRVRMIKGSAARSVVAFICALTLTTGVIDWFFVPPEAQLVLPSAVVAVWWLSRIGSRRPTGQVARRL